MTAYGFIRNGKLEIDHPIALPEGLRVEVHFTVPAEKEVPSRDSIIAILDEACKDVPADAWNNLPTDGALNHDHYLYGAPKVGDI